MSDSNTRVSAGDFDTAGPHICQAQLTLAFHGAMGRVFSGIPYRGETASQCTHVVSAMYICCKEYWENEGPN